VRCYTTAAHLREDLEKGWLNAQERAYVITGMQFKRTGIQAAYQTVNVSSLEEAEKLLDARP
jgi:small-conductance mechanosensitive channel